MASGATRDGVFGNVFEGSISNDDIGIQRRPYHRGCSCALHKSDEHHGSHASSRHKVSYLIRRSWNEGSLVALTSVAAGSTASSPYCASSPAKTMTTTVTTRLPLRGANVDRIVRFVDLLGFLRGFGECEIRLDEIWLKLCKCLYCIWFCC
ncbi:hypothetical protein Hanom_Chr13g01228081 [Helianthus anomalus]